MGGTAPYCPYCRKPCEGLKDHIKAKHPTKYRTWLEQGRPPYWRHDEHGNLRINPYESA